MSAGVSGETTRTDVGGNKTLIDCSKWCGKEFEISAFGCFAFSALIAYSIPGASTITSLQITLFLAEMLLGGVRIKVRGKLIILGDSRMCMQRREYDGQLEKHAVQGVGIN